MAIDPATLQAAAKIAASVVSNEKGRQAIFIASLSPLIILLLVLSSPFAIFFALTEGEGEFSSIISIMQEMKQEFRYQVESEQADLNAHEIQMIYQGSEENTYIDNTEDVLISFALMQNVNQENPEQVAVLSKEQIENLRQIFFEMNTISSESNTFTESYVRISVDEKGSKIREVISQEKVIKTVQVNSMTAEEFAESSGFSDEQRKIIPEMRKSGFVGWVSVSAYDSGLTGEQIQEIQNYLPKDSTLTRETIVEKALSIVGQVPYFWGGKSLAIDWDHRWGSMTEVTSLGSKSTGTSEPFGLDCSGFVVWVYINAGLPTTTVEQTIGYGTSAQWKLSESLSKSYVEPGDLAFLAVPGTRKINHVGIVVGKDEAGNTLVAHCTSSADNVVVTTAEEGGFMYYRRPAVLTE